MYAELGVVDAVRRCDRDTVESSSFPLNMDANSLFSH